MESLDNQSRICPDTASTYTCSTYTYTYIHTYTFY